MALKKFSLMLASSVSSISCLDCGFSRKFWHQRLLYESDFLDFFADLCSKFFFHYSFNFLRSRNYFSSFLVIEKPTFWPTNFHDSTMLFIFQLTVFLQKNAIVNLGSLAFVIYFFKLLISLKIYQNP